MKENAVKAVIDQYIANNRVDATSRDLTRLYAVSSTIGAVSDLRADSVAQVPMVIRDPRGDIVDKSHPLYNMFRGGYSFSDIMRRTELTMYFWGRNLLQKKRNGFRVPVGLRWVNPNMYSLDRTSTAGLRGFRVYASSQYQIEPVRYIDLKDAVYMHGVDFDDDFDGVAPAERAFLEASIEPEQAQTALAVFRNLAIPAAIAQPEADVKSTPTPTEVKTFIEMLRRMFQGAQNAGRTLVSPHRWQWVTLQTPLKDLAMKEVKEEARLSVCIASRIPLELIVPSAANYAQFEGARRTWGQAWLVPQCKWYADVFTEQLAREFGDGWMVEPDFEQVPFLKEDAKARVDVVNAKLGAGYITLYSAALELGDEPDPVLKDLYMVQGIPVPKTELVNLWKTHFAPALPSGALADPTGVGLPALPPPDTTALLPAPAASADPLEADKDGAGKSLFVGLQLGANADLVALQSRVAEVYPDAKLNDPADFHVTLLYAPVADDVQAMALQTALQALDVPEMTLSIGSLKSFDNVGEHALHFRVRHNTDLIELQESIYDAAVDCGIAVSYSKPENYTPHVTMGYCETKPHAITFGGKVSVEPVGIKLCLEDDELWSLDLRKPETTKRAASDDLHRELKNWRIVAGRKGRGYGFKVEILPRRVADYIRVALEDGDDLDSVFAEAQEMVNGGWAVKSYPDTRTSFMREIVGIIGRGQADEVSRQKFAGEMRSATRRYGLMAFRDGMESEGYSPESFSPEELAVFRVWQAETSEYVSAFGAEVFKQGITEFEVASRADAWGNKSLQDIYYRGALLAAPQKKKRWKRDPQKDSCTDCIERDGQVKTYAEWAEIGLPGDSRLACHGDHCGCGLEDAEEAVGSVAA